MISLLPPAEAGFVMAAAPFDRLDGLDLREAGGDVSSPAHGSRATPFGAVIPKYLYVVKLYFSNPFVLVS